MKKENSIHWFYKLLFVLFLMMCAGLYLASTTKFELKDKAPSLSSEKKEITAEVVALKELTPDRLATAIEKLKTEVVDKLMSLESSGVSPVGGTMFITFDPSDSMYSHCITRFGIMNIDCLSFGPLQMKVHTIQGWQKALGDKVDDDQDAMTLAMDTKEAKAFAKRVIFGIKGSIWSWTKAKDTAEHKTWFETRISLIRELETI
jgi:hypothetical protein